MSFEPVTRWVLRCDGGGSHGRCTQQLVFLDHPDDDPDCPLAVWRAALYDRPDLDGGVEAELRYAGWLLVRDGRMLCARHVAGLEFLAAAAIDGLPFDDGLPLDDGDPR